MLQRYTMRLLTLDQLARAATLICALERLRHGKPKELGNARIAVGLWVGASASANRMAEVKKALADASAGQSESPFPLTACPWCGDAIRVQNIKLLDASGKPVRKGFTRAAVYCGSAGCDFDESKSTGAGLPVLFVDEQIYDEVPAFIVATVDKFAMQPWRGDAGLLFGSEKAELLVRTASHAYFSQVVSALRLPPPQLSAIEQRLQSHDLWNAVRKVESRPKLELLMELQDKVALGLAGLDLDQVVQAIANKRAADVSTVERPLRSVEYERFIEAPLEQEGVLPERDAEFAAYRVPNQRLDLPKGVAGLVVVPVMREVRVQVSFSRFDSISANLQGEYDFAARSAKPAVLTLPSGSQKWLPACEVRGEGIFLQLDEAALVAWESRPAVQERAEKLRRGVEAEGQGDFHGVRFYMLHSLSHLLLTAISLECGYSASSIRERLYAGQAEPNGPQLAGILLSTGTTGSEGTLGGLVEEGRRIRHHLREAWELGRLCSNEPVCAAHDPSAQSGDRHTEGAACHGCLYIAETSCERYNRFLDRALVVPTIGNDPELGFFKERP